MADTRKIFGIGQGIPGFSPGQGLMNQKNQTCFKAGPYSWKLHATIHGFSASGSGTKQVRKVSGFHVSLYSDGKSWGRFVWEYSSSGDTYKLTGYEGSPKDMFGDSAAQDKIRTKANGIARALKSTIGGSSVATAAW